MEDAVDILKKISLFISVLTTQVRKSKTIINCNKFKRLKRNFISK